MTILLFGVSNVGKTTTGRLLAERLGYSFFDLDEEVKKTFNITLEEFVSTGPLFLRDQVRCAIIFSLLKNDIDKVIAVTPLSYMKSIKPYLLSSDIVSIELIDSPENIFDRLVFSDENDNIYEDDEYKNKHKQHYLKEICEDLEWYGAVYSDIKNKFDMHGCAPKAVVDKLIFDFHLKERKKVKRNGGSRRMQRK